MKLLLRLALVAVFVSVGLAAPAHASSIVEPGASVNVKLDGHGKPEPFTITVSGFAPLARVFVEQCDGTPATNPTFKPTIDCDVGTQAAGKRADAHGTVTFPANDLNYSFKPMRGTSPEQLFNCLAPGDPSPNNGLPTSTTCTVRVASNYVEPTADQLFITMHFGASSSSHAAPWIWIAVGAGLVALAVVVVLVVRRRSASAAR